MLLHSVLSPLNLVPRPLTALLQKLTEKVDIYSLAMVYYSMLALHPPYADVPDGTGNIKEGIPPTTDPSWHPGFLEVRNTTIMGSRLRADEVRYRRSRSKGGTQRWQFVLLPSFRDGHFMNVFSPPGSMVSGIRGCVLGSEHRRQHTSQSWETPETSVCVWRLISPGCLLSR